MPLNSVYETALERFSIMDQTGYDAVWLAEHHFSSFSVCPSVHMMGTMAAARTKRLRIGMAVSLAPFYNPLRLAEEVALLDVLSGGRVNWGAGRGFERSEFAAFGIPGEESAARFHETVDIVLQGLDQPAAHLSRQVLPLRRRRGAAQTVAGAAPAGLDGGVVHSRHRLGSGPGPLDPDGPAFVPRRSGQQAPALRREAGRRLGSATLAAPSRWLGWSPSMKRTEKARAVAKRVAEWTIASYVGPKHTGNVRQEVAGISAARIRSIIIWMT